MIIEVLLGVLIANTIYQGIRIHVLLDKTKYLHDIQDKLSSVVHKNDLMIHKRIDQEIDRVNNLHKDSIQYTNYVTKQDSAKNLIKG